MKGFLIILVLLILGMIFFLLKKGEVKSSFMRRLENDESNIKNCSKTSQLSIEQRCLNEESIREINQKIQGVQKDLSRIRQEYKGIQELIEQRNANEWYQSQKRIYERISILENKVEELESKIAVNVSNVNLGAIDTQNDVRYVKNFGKGVLKELSKGDAQFVLRLLTTTEAEFSYCGDFDEACAKQNSIFDDVAQLNGNVQNSTKIRTIEKGIVVLEGGKWKVTKKATIKFE